MKTIAVVLPVFNSVDQALRCLNILCSDQNPNIQIIPILIDDGSTDGTASKVRDKYPEVILLEGNGKLWWAGGVNKGLKFAAAKIECEFIIIMNSDTRFEYETIEKLINNYQKMRKKSVWCPLTINELTKRIYNAGYIINQRTKEVQPYLSGREPDEYRDQILSCDAVSSRLVLMPKTILKDVGYFDQNKYPHGYSDVDYFLRAAKKGYRSYVVTNCRIYMSTNKNYFQYRLINCNIFQYIKSFFQIKYDTNIKMLYYISTSNNRSFWGLLIFGKKLCSQLRWILLKLLLKKERLKKIITTKVIH